MHPIMLSTVRLLDYLDLPDAPDTVHFIHGGERVLAHKTRLGLVCHPGPVIKHFDHYNSMSGIVGDDLIHSVRR